MIVIYKITNKVNWKIYVGQTSRTLDWRWKRHISNSKTKNMYFSKAIRKYGAASFKVEELESVETREQANEREKFWISEFKSCEGATGYNGTFGGEGCPTPEVLKYRNERIKQALSDPAVRDRHRASIAGAKHPRYGKPLSEETKQKLRIANSGPKDDAFKAAVSRAVTGEKNPMYGRNHSEATRALMRELCIGRYAGVKHPQYNHQINVEELKDEYLKCKNTFKVAEKFGVSQTLVYQRLKPLGILQRTRNANPS